MDTIKLTNTKKEILTAYEQALKKIKELEAKLLNPAKKVKEKKQEQIKIKAEKIVGENLDESFSELKENLVSVLDDMFNKLDSQTKKYKTMQEAIELKENELREIFEIDKTAASLAGLIEAQNETKRKYGLEMEQKKSLLESEINTLRNSRIDEKLQYENKKKSTVLEDKQKREREQEEYKYNFNRKKLLAENQLKDQLAESKRKALDEIENQMTDIEAREIILKNGETEIEQLREKTSTFEDDINKAVQEAIVKTTANVKLNSQHKLELTTKQLNGEKEVLLTKIEALETKVQEQGNMIETLSGKLEKSYENVQNVAVKAIEGASNSNYRNIKESLSERRDAE